MTRKGRGALGLQSAGRNRDLRAAAVGLLTCSALLGLEASREWRTFVPGRCLSHGRATGSRGGSGRSALERSSDRCWRQPSLSSQNSATPVSLLLPPDQFRLWAHCCQSGADRDRQQAQHCRHPSCSTGRRLRVETCTLAIMEAAIEPRALRASHSPGRSRLLRCALTEQWLEPLAARLPSPLMCRKLHRIEQTISRLCCDFQRRVVRCLRPFAAIRPRWIEPRAAYHQRKPKQRR